MPDGSSNIRVFVHWRDQTVFAGEDVKCTITFRNAAQDPDPQHQHQHQHQQGQGQPGVHARRQSQSEHHRFGSPLQSRKQANANSTPLFSSSSPGARGHRRAALSLSVPSSAARSRPGPGQFNRPASANTTTTSYFDHAHKRSVSIISIPSTPVDDHNQQGYDPPPQRQQRSRHSHHRASSLQISSWGMPAPQSTPQSGIHSQRHTSSPLANSSFPSERFERLGSASSPPVLKGASQYILGSPRASPQPMPEFRFPAAPPSEFEGPTSPRRSPNGLLSPKSRQSDASVLPVRIKEQTSSERPALTPRILSSTSMAGGTPRSSGEFYSVSNNSSETLVSEYVTQPVVRGNGRPNHSRGSLMSTAHSRSPESLMMGFARIQGAFTLDSSLVSPAPFEQVKRKTVVSGKGGGVVGIESGRRENSLLRSFGFGGITNSLGDLLGGGELSTMKEMRGAANSKSVPILSTPQSILFVDLQLAPGESRTFEYTFKLPKGLPPTHKGKAIKISYSLIIGTQRVGSVKEQQVRTAEIPFRILGSVDDRGEVPEHDLMSPYVLLRDLAQVKSIGKETDGRVERKRGSPSVSSAGMNDFLTYVDELATRSRDEANGGLLTPTTDPNQKRQSVIFDEPTSAKEAIRLAIMRSNMTGEGQQSPNRFEIARNGQRVGVVMLTRPAYRLGEVVTMVIDFAEASIPCYAVHTTLESTERVDPSLAIRSESSIQRVTRKVYVASSEATLYTRRVVFTATIPVSATPDFITSGVSLEWKIRVEFVVPSQAEGGKGGHSTATNTTTTTTPTQPCPLLEQISEDEKGGLVLVAVENMVCESFDVLVPLRVYGAVGTGLERLEWDEASEEGLVI